MPAGAICCDPCLRIKIVERGAGRDFPVESVRIDHSVGIFFDQPVNDIAAFAQVIVRKAQIMLCIADPEKFLVVLIRGLKFFKY